jgi:hypothetical protein
MYGRFKKNDVWLVVNCGDWSMEDERRRMAIRS